MEDEKIFFVWVGEGFQRKSQIIEMYDHLLKKIIFKFFKNIQN